MKEYKVVECEVSKDWMIVKGNQAYDYGFKTKESAEEELFKMENQSRIVIDGVYID